MSDNFSSLWINHSYDVRLKKMLPLKLKPDKIKGEVLNYYVRMSWRAKKNSIN